MNSLTEKLSRMREAMTNLNRVGGVGPSTVQMQHVSFVINAMAEVIEEAVQAKTTPGAELAKAADAQLAAANKLAAAPMKSADQRKLATAGK